jgi:hypothetical protein
MTDISRNNSTNSSKTWNECCGDSSDSFWCRVISCPSQHHWARGSASGYTQEACTITDAPSVIVMCSGNYSPSLRVFSANKYGIPDDAKQNGNEDAHPTPFCSEGKVGIGYCPDSAHEVRRYRSQLGLNRA